MNITKEERIRKMDKLKEVKYRYMSWEYDFNLNKDDIDWLIEQAEKAEQYKAELNSRFLQVTYLLDEVKSLEIEVQKLKDLVSQKQNL
jgi:hypothetical protein